MMTSQTPSIEEIRAAQAALASVIDPTALTCERALGERFGMPSWLKCENLQRTGSFKIRGAYWKLRRLLDEGRPAGVIAASAGNHAQGVAFAAREVGLPACLVMPETAPLAKVAATQSYGAEIVLAGATYDEARETAERIAQDRGYSYVPAFDDPAIIAGQGTIGLEVVAALPEVEQIVVPVGGGGLISGIALAAKSYLPAIRVIGVQAEAAPSAAQSWRAGRPIAVDSRPTLADGLAVKSPGRITWPLIERLVDDFATVSEARISEAIVWLIERTKLIAEGAGATPLAALLSGAVVPTGPTILILSGGNVDLTLLDRIVQHGLTALGRYLVVRLELSDRPGILHRLSGLIAAERANIVQIIHNRTGRQIGPAEVEVELTLELRTPEQAATLLHRLNETGYHVLDASH